MNDAGQCDEIPVGDCLMKIARQPKVKTNAYKKKGTIPVIDQGKAFVGGYVDDPSLAYSGPLPVVVFGDHNRSMKFVKERFAVGADGTQLLYPDDRFDVRYFYYALRSLPLKNYGYERHFKYLKEERLQLWPLTMQRRIASILSAYDDLIENNTRRIAILEEVARRLHEEWFVNFRFPGHANMRMVESELGPVPYGWEARPLGSLVTHHIGGGWGQEAQSEEFSVPAYVIRGTDIPDVRGGSLGRSPLRYHTPSNFRNRRLESRDIVFEVSGGSKDQPVGRAVMVSERLLARAAAPVICASFCRLVRVDAAEILPELLQLHFQRIYANRQIMQYQTQSTGITNFKFTVFLEKELVLKPSSEVQAQFAEIVRPILHLADILGIKNSSLRATRDLLLPKLISGELDVSELPEPEAATA